RGTLPLHVLGREPADKERLVGEWVTAETGQREVYRGVFATLHPQVWKELQAMARASRRKLEFDIRPVVEYMGLEEVIRQIGREAVIEQIGKKKVLEQFEVDDILTSLPPAKRQQLMRRLQEESGRANR